LINDETTSGQAPFLKGTRQRFLWIAGPDWINCWVNGSAPTHIHLIHR